MSRNRARPNEVCIWLLTGQERVFTHSRRGLYPRSHLFRKACTRDAPRAFLLARDLGVTKRPFAKRYCNSSTKAWLRPSQV